MHKDRMTAGDFHDLACFNPFQYFNRLGSISGANRHQRHQAALDIKLGFQLFRNQIWPSRTTLGASPSKFHVQFLKSVERDRAGGNIVNHTDRSRCKVRL
jgi:hypothetical protein